MLWNSVISTKDAKYMTMDIKNFYLCCYLDRSEYMKMPITIFPQHIIDQYQLMGLVYKGYIWIEIKRSIYGLPQAGKLANEFLRQKLAPHGYYEVKHTPGLWKHITKPLIFTLTVDDFGVKYVGKHHVLHLLGILEKEFTAVSTDWDGKRLARLRCNKLPGQNSILGIRHDFTNTLLGLRLGLGLGLLGCPRYTSEYWNFV
eukprot:scaffold207401_cov39-Attheya_sp.AAC.1